jgi:hypothetical protein
LKLEIWKLVLLFNKENIGMEAGSHKSFEDLLHLRMRFTIVVDKSADD